MNKLHRFLDSVTWGTGGLAIYRPVPGQLPTTAMTAEAYAMRLMLNHSFANACPA